MFSFVLLWFRGDWLVDEMVVAELEGVVSSCKSGDGHFTSLGHGE
jgi:hypothetical protein